MKSLLVVAFLAGIGAWTILSAAEDVKTVVYPGKISYRISMDDTFEVIPKPGWTMYPLKELSLRLGIVRIHGKNDEFSLQLNFVCDTPDLSRLNTPDKMKYSLNRRTQQFFMESLERVRKEHIMVRSFAPFGRFGFAVRFTDRKYADEKPTAGEWKYLTCGLFRLSEDSVLLFTLMTNTIDDASYVSLLDYIAAFQHPEIGEKNWKVANGKQAAEIASAEFAKKYPAESLLRQRPYTVVLRNGKWLVHGNMWWLYPGGVAEAEIDGATGKVLRITHGK